MSKPLVAIVGRPNVGKSTLFNRLTGSRRSIVGDEPGITRDRIYGDVEWRAKEFEVVDTGGIVPDDEALIPKNIFIQAGAAISAAQAIIWVVDARAGVTPLDEELAVLLRNTGKPVYVAANKSESRRVSEDASEFYRFGFEVVPVSAEHGTSVGDLLQALYDEIEFEDPQEEDDSDEIKLAIIGRPNVGKSSILNRILGEDRVIVSPIAGTTRDAIDTRLESEGKRFLLIDTAGIRRKGKTTEMAEKLSVIMARKALERADVAVLVLDAVEGVTHLDASIAGYAIESGCSIIIAVNKWDLISEKDTSTASEFERRLRDKMKFLDWAPVVTTSALTGQRLTRLLPLVDRANEARNQRVPTSALNDLFEKTVMQPKGGGGTAPAKGGRTRVNVKYITQAGIRPPMFVLFTSGRAGSALHFSYLRYIENRLRAEFEFFATPIRLKERKKSKKTDRR
ncbi:MAG: ribosome biogenesis GTPase Der [Acidobacteria bacterium]|nr:MAG: ribosome biogenesis GTPase Der [Acidobacteriota bacterium]REK01925.1 MAG: ribosome biogenesis GTPase Der [Acidobacteriota bacterium]REK14881.1 MAG: ribosome biogenesis GTPase Der [Acidobacteriota bacterium]REK45596.1 MAG: ribosome biogenesis GTPase Der [Acidobacteriota bacterium]